MFGNSITVPEEQSILSADNSHGQTTNGFMVALRTSSSTTTWLFAARMHGQVDAGYERHVKILIGKEFEASLENGDNIEKWHSYEADRV